MTRFDRFNGPVEKANKDVSDILEKLKREFAVATSGYSCGRKSDWEEVITFGFEMREGFREVISRIVKLEEEVS